MNIILELIITPNETKIFFNIIGEIIKYILIIIPIGVIIFFIIKFIIYFIDKIKWNKRIKFYKNEKPPNNENKYKYIRNEEEEKEFQKKIKELNDKIFNENIKNNNKEKKYKLKQSQITNIEKYFYDIIKKNFNNLYDIQRQVPLSSIIIKEKEFNKQYQNELNRVIDFGIFNKTTLKPLLLIEINDSTHLKKDRKQRDLKVKSICENAGIKIITFWTNCENKESYIINRINKELRG